MLKILGKRIVWQVGLVLAFLSFGFLHAIDNSYPSAHALCPFGGLVSLYSLATTGTFIHRTHGSSLFLLAAIVLSALLLGRIFCGWFCPLGALGEWSRRLGKKLGIKRLNFTGWSDTILKSLKYLLLAGILYFTWTMGELFYRGWCPWSAFMTIFEPDELLEDILAGGLILLLVLGLSLAVERFFCRYLCPLGAALTIFNRLSLIKPLRDQSCRNCKACEQSCPVGIKVADLKTINNAECIRCYQCIDHCPDQGSLTFNVKALRSYQAGLAAALVIGIVVITTIQLGYWEKGRVIAFQDSSQPRQQDAALTGRAAYEEGFADTYPADGEIPGSPGAGESFQGSSAEPAETFQEVTATATIDEVAELAGLTVPEVLTAWDLPADYDSGATLRVVMESTGLSRRQLLLKLPQDP